MRPAEARNRLSTSGHDEDDATALARHLPTYRGGDVEVPSNRVGHGAHEVLELHVEERCALDIVVGGGIEADVDAAAGRGHSTGVPLDRNPVLDINPRDVSRSATGSDALSNGIEARFGAADEMHFGALLGVSLRYR
jgi:hypothetical protein